MTEFDPGGPNEPTTYNLLFVCTGNTCRSPMAAAIARAELRRRGWTHVAVESAGAAAVTGQPASEHTVRVLGDAGIDIQSHQTKLLTPELVARADLILVMSSSHLFSVTDMGGGGKVALVTDFLEGDELGTSVEDPFGSDVEAYRRTYDQLQRAIASLLSRLEPILSP